VQLFQPLAERYLHLFHLSRCVEALGWLVLTRFDIDLRRFCLWLIIILPDGTGFRIDASFQACQLQKEADSSQKQSRGHAMRLDITTIGTESAPRRAPILSTRGKPAP